MCIYTPPRLFFLSFHFLCSGWAAFFIPFCICVKIIYRFSRFLASLKSIKNPSPSTKVLQGSAFLTCFVQNGQASSTRTTHRDSSDVFEGQRARDGATTVTSSIWAFRRPFSYFSYFPFLFYLFSLSSCTSFIFGFIFLLYIDGYILIWSLQKKLNDFFTHVSCRVSEKLTKIVIDCVQSYYKLHQESVVLVF